MLIKLTFEFANITFGSTFLQALGGDATPAVKVSAGTFEWMIKRKSESVPRKEDFKRIRQLEPYTMEKLDKLRNDLESSIERTVRISDYFLRELHKQAQISNRVRLATFAANDIQFHSD
ncbi:hypothetical protein PsorP6_010302 [Peronosclerospora sorghi]|uniref:Uncharacterized protein n=1 Tax=Peronosclerospora sorghi TaxID=230839 RepID=A0ACC0VVR8_9STRA|nr:hypothetical protein PsorP6_010302 [Peronosclerospora sorghi]